MTFTFTAMLCLGLTLGLRTPVLAGSLPKPVLSVQPDSVISTHTEVIFLCEGIRGAKEYRLYKEGYPYPYLWSTKITQKPGDKAEFSFSNIGHQQAGLYQCQYETQAESSEYSDSLELVVTGVYGQPSLSALPSPVVTSGGNVTLQCVSWQKYMLILTLEGQQKLSWRLDSQYNLYTGMFQALFFVAPLTPKKRWIFRCYSYDRSIPQVWSYPSEPLEILISGNLKKTTIKAEPGPVIAIRSAMTIWCQGILDAEIYVLHKEGNQKPWRTQTPKKSWKKAKFSIPSVTQQHAGQYRCYSYSSAGWTEHSNTLELVVTGIYNFDKPKLLAMPSHVVTSGGSMTLQCVSLYHYDKFILTKEDQIFPSSMETQYMHSSRQYQAQFSRGHMTPNCTGTFRCYGYYKHTPQLWSVPSEPLEIHISGLSRKPYLLAHQGYILDPGMKLILQCVSDVNYDRFVLYKVGGAINMQHHSKQTQAGLCLTNFTLGYVRHDTGGQYICYGAHNHSSEWSASSDPVDILITGQLPVTPTLSVKPNSTVHSGQNVTLLCWLKYQVDTFILSKEGSVHQPLHLKSKFQDGQFQAKFFMSALTSTFMGTYRCYASQNSSLYLLSFASAPVELIVSEPTRVSSSPPSRNMPAAGLESYLKALIGVSVTFLLIIFIFIFFLLRRRHQGNFRKDAPKETELSLPAGATEPITRDRGPQKRSNPAAITQEDSLYASVEDMQPENGVDLDSQKLSDDDSQGQTYAEVKPSRLRRAEVFLPSVIPRECLNTRDEQPEEGREVESQAEESKESQDVTYAQLDRRDLHLLSPGQGNETGCCSSRGVPKKQVAMTCQNA